MRLPEAPTPRYRLGADSCSFRGGYAQREVDVLERIPVFQALLNSPTENQSFDGSGKESEERAQLAATISVSATL